MNTFNDMCRKLHTAVALKARDEKGEIASWLILAAGLCVAALAASSTLDGAIKGLANNIVESASKAGSGGGGGGDGFWNDVGGAVGGAVDFLNPFN